MSGAAANSRAKMRRTVPDSNITGTTNTTNTTNTTKKGPQTPGDFLIKHDYDIHILKQQFKQFILNNNNTSAQPINEDILSEALSSLDTRLEKLENENKELKNLLLKLQNISMETSVKLMQMKESNNNNLQMQN